MKKLYQLGLTTVLTYGYAASALADDDDWDVPVAVDEPGTLLLLTVGLATAFAVARKLRKK